MSNEGALSLQLRELRMTQMAQEWQRLETRALSEGWPPSDYLKRLCNMELAHRESARLKRYLKEAKLPAGKTLSSFNFENSEGLNSAQMVQLCQNRDWIDDGKNVLLFGASGLGKTHLAAAIAYGAIEQGIRARFYTATALVQQLQVAKQGLRLNELLLKLDRLKLLVIDDLGYVKRDSTETSVLFELIAHRYEQGSLILTANQPFSQWDSIFADKMMTVAAVDRLVHHAYIFELSGESYRKKAAKSQE